VSSGRITFRLRRLRSTRPEENEINERNERTEKGNDGGLVRVCTVNIGVGRVDVFVLEKKPKTDESFCLVLDVVLEARIIQIFIFNVHEQRAVGNYTRGEPSYAPSRVGGVRSNTCYFRFGGFFFCLCL